MANERYETSETALSTDANDAHALIYEPEAESIVRARWPKAIIEDAGSDLRQGRFSVTFPGLTCDEVYPALLVEGITCLEIELALRMPEKIDDVRRWLDTAKALKATQEAS